MPKRIRLFIALLLLSLVPAALLSQAPSGQPGKETKTEKEKKPAPEEKSSRTQHTINLDGQRIAYTATAGTIVLKDDEGTPKASVFYIAYTRDGVKNPADRPVTFSFNGGPGAASLWVHLGAFGPKKVERDDEGMGTPPPGRLVDNDQSILDVSDLVFIDPVSTGFSRPAPGEDPKQFHGVQQDVESVGELIRLWVTRNERWASPKFMAGESYGTTRAAGLAHHLADRYGMEMNGVILISSVLNWQNQEFHTGNDMPFIIHLPTYTATAWYHKKLPPELKDLRATLAEAEEFARNEYALALMQGDRLPDARRREIAAKVARYTGLSPTYVERANLRVDIYRFIKELLRDQGKTVGRLDSRFTGTDLDAVGEYSEYDPSSVSLDGPYAAAVNDYLRRELGFKEDLVYERLNRKVWPWNYSEFANQYLNMAEMLRRAMTRNPDLKVLITSGYYDLATPYFDSFYTVDHLGLPAELRGNVRVTTYESGHMMYIRKADHQKLKHDVVELIRGTAP
ncbi:MAG TPA: peptidase S10 [Thermoanaerobaculia bacterium]